MELALVSNPLMEPKEYFHSEKSSQQMNCETDSPMPSDNPIYFVTCCQLLRAFLTSFFFAGQVQKPNPETT